MTQTAVRVENFDALAFEIKHAEDYEQSQQSPLEIASKHCYETGITKFKVTSSFEVVGQYWRDPWGIGWVATAPSDDTERHFDSDTECLEYLSSTYC